MGAVLVLAIAALVLVLVVVAPVLVLVGAAWFHWLVFVPLVDAAFFLLLEVLVLNVILNLALKVSISVHYDLLI